VFFIEVAAWSGEPHVAEVDHAQSIAWYAPEDIPQPMVPYVRQVLECIDKGILYSEWGWAPSLR